MTDTADEKRATAALSQTELIDAIFATNEVGETTHLLEKLLDRENIETERVDNHDRKRVRVDSTQDLFLKTIRDSRNTGMGLFCGLVTNRLLKELGAPVGPVNLANPDEHKPVLVQPFYEEGDAQQGPHPTDTVNADELANLYVLELWVNNADDKAKHIRFTETEAGLEARAIDHSHALHRYWYQEGEPEDISNIDGPLFNPSNQSAGENPELYGVGSVGATEEGLEFVEAITDSKIVEIVDDVLAQLCSLKTDDADIEKFLEKATDHREITIRLLLERQNGIRKLAKDRLASH